MGTKNGGLLKLLARPSCHSALMERLTMGRSELRGHPFGKRLEWLLARVDQAYARSGLSPRDASATLLLNPIQQGEDPAKDTIPVSDLRGSPKRFRWRNFFASSAPESPSTWMARTGKGIRS